MFVVWVLSNYHFKVKLDFLKNVKACHIILLNAKKTKSNIY